MRLRLQRRSSCSTLRKHQLRWLGRSGLSRPSQLAPPRFKPAESNDVARAWARLVLAEQLQGKKEATSHL